MGDAPGLSINVQHLLDRRGCGRIERFQCLAGDRRNIEEADAIVQKGCDGDLVCRVEYGGPCATGCQSLSGEGERGEELQPAQDEDDADALPATEAPIVGAHAAMAGSMLYASAMTSLRHIDEITGVWAAFPGPLRADTPHRRPRSRSGTRHSGTLAMAWTWPSLSIRYESAP